MSTTDTADLVRQLRDALDDAHDDVQVELMMCQQRAGYPKTDRELSAQIALARRVDDAIAAADAWLAGQRAALTDERKPCRCGPDGCADSSCPGRSV